MWAAQVKGQLDKWGSAVLNNEKRCRIRDALSPPASEIIDDLKRNKS